MAFPIIPLLAGLALIFGSRSSRAPAPAPRPTGAALPDSSFGPVLERVPLDTPPPAPSSTQLARAQTVEPWNPPPNMGQAPPATYNTFQGYQGPDRRLAAQQLTEYLRTHTGSRRDPATIRYYQGILGAVVDGRYGPNTQGAIDAAMQAPYQQQPQNYGFDPNAQQPPFQGQPTPYGPSSSETASAKTTGGGWSPYNAPNQGSYNGGGGGGGGGGKNYSGGGGDSYGKGF